MQDLEVHRNYARLLYRVSIAWDSISDNVIQEYIRTMPERCQAVIDAQGGLTVLDRFL